MAEDGRMTVADVVANVLAGEQSDFVREAVAIIAREMMGGRGVGRDRARDPTQALRGGLLPLVPGAAPVLVECPAERRDTVLAHPLDPELLHQPVDLPRRDAVDVRLQDDRDDSLLGAPGRGVLQAAARG